ncbi:MAG: hypothetical protein R2882_03830 [Gemmatimonadales bacterium]
MKALYGLGAVLLAAGPAAAQVRLAGQGGVAEEARAQQEVAVLSRFGPDARARLQSILDDARRRGLPTGPLLDQMTEGKAGGRAEPAIVEQITQASWRLETASRALSHAGRDQVDPREIVAGAEVLRRGATSAQLESVIRTAPAARSLIVPLEVLIRLTDGGLPVDNALARVSGKLVSRASDGEIRGLLTAGS